MMGPREIGIHLYIYIDNVCVNFVQSVQFYSKMVYGIKRKIQDNYS